MPEYAPLLRLQRDHEQSYRSPGLFTISGGTRQTHREAKKNFLDALNLSHLSDQQRREYKDLQLGLVGEHGE